jgi:hypothetical protein
LLCRFTRSASGAVDEVALGVVDFHGADLGQGGGIVDEFGDGFKAGEFCDFAEASDGCLVEGAVDEVVDELAVDFQEIDVERFEVAE